MVDAVSRGVPRVHLTTPGLGPSEAFRACLGPGMALERLRMASKALGRGVGYFSKKVPHKPCRGLKGLTVRTKSAEASALLHEVFAAVPPGLGHPQSSSAVEAAVPTAIDMANTVC